MQLTVREVAELFKLSEKTIYRWIKKGELPVYRVSDQYRFNRAELLEWAMANKIGVSADFFREKSPLAQPLPSLTDALQSGGIVYRLAAENKIEVLRRAVSEMHFPAQVDREQLLQVLLAREALSSTGVGDGIAIPHVRNPIVLQVPEPTITLCFLEKPVEFGALDGQPVYCLFTMVSPTVRIHLHLLSRLSFALRDKNFHALIKRQGLRDEILEALGRVEAGLLKAPSDSKRESSSQEQRKA